MPPSRRSSRLVLGRDTSASQKKTVVASVRQFQMENAVAVKKSCPDDVIQRNRRALPVDVDHLVLFQIELLSRDLMDCLSDGIELRRIADVEIAGEHSQLSDLFDDQQANQGIRVVA